MLKRFVVTVFVSALAVVGVAPAASAAAGHTGSSHAIHLSIDWD